MTSVHLSNPLKLSLYCLSNSISDWLLRDILLLLKNHTTILTMSLIGSNGYLIRFDQLAGSSQEVKDKPLM